MKRILVGLFAAAMIFAVAQNAQADTVAVSLDMPVGYSASDSNFASPKASGYMVGLTLPLFFGLGMDKYTVDGNVLGTPISNDVSIVNIFFGLPFIPVINTTVGGGVGKGTFTGLVPDAPDMSQWFISLGYDVFGPLDVHLSHRAVSGTSALNANLGVGGSMTTLGLKFGF